MTPFLKLDCASTGNSQEIDGVVCSASINGVVCSASINEDINEGVCIPSNG